MHFKFAITTFSTIGAVAAAVANGDLAVAAFIMLWYDICNYNAVLRKFTPVCLWHRRRQPQGTCS